MTKENNKKVYIHSCTKKSIFFKNAVLQFAGTILVVIALVILAIILWNKDQNTAAASTTEPQVIEKEVVVEKEVKVEVPVEVEKEVEVIKYQTIEVPVEKIVEVEKIIEKEIPVTEVVTETVTVEVPVEKIVEVEKIVKVVDEEQVNTLAEEKAQQLLEQYKSEYQTEYAEEVEAQRLANTSVITVNIRFKNEASKDFKLEISGALYEELTYEKIYNALAETGALEGYKVDRITNRDAVELFAGRDFLSTRSIQLVRI